MADILKIARDFNPKKALTHIFDKIDEIIKKVNTLWSNAPTVTPKVYKALLTQSGTSAPVATVLVNTLSGTPVWSRNGVGDYQMVLSNAFVDFAKVYIPYSNDNTGNGYTITPVYNGASISGYYTFYISDPDTLILTTLDNTLTPIELGALIGTYFPVPPIEVYP